MIFLIYIKVFAGASNVFELYEDDGLTTEFKNGKFAFTKFELDWSKKPVFTIYAPEGDTSFIPEKRSYEIEFIGATECKDISVTVDGKPADSLISYVDGVTIVELGKVEGEIVISFNAEVYEKANDVKSELISFLEPCYTNNNQKAFIAMVMEDEKLTLTDTVAFSKDVVVTRRTTKYSTFQFNGKITYDGENLLLTQENAVDVIVNEGWENWEMWPARVSGNVRVGTGNCKLYVNKLTVTSAAQNATVNDFILNRTFTSADTEAALEAEGWDIKMSPYAITADALAAMEVGYDADIAGDYTVEINATKKQNNTDIYIRYDKTAKTGYMVRSRLASGYYISVGKLENGTYVEKERLTVTEKRYDTSNTNYYVSVADEGDNVKVSLKVVRGTVVSEQPWTDKKTDDNTPIKSGGFLYKTDKYCGTADSPLYVSSIKAYPTATGSKEVSDVDVKYLMNNTEIETIEADGAVYMKMPTAILGQDFSIICALYEDGVMKGITQVAPIEAYNANGVKLFNTTGLSGKVSVKTFIWSGINQMQALTTSKGI